MKKRNLFGGALLGAVALGIYLGQFWKGPGLGGGGAGDTFSLTNGSEQVQSGMDRNAVSAPAQMEKTSGEKPAEIDLGLPALMVTIVVHDQKYRLVTGDNPKVGTDLTLDEVKRYAGETVGSADGIRVRILKERDAREGARSDLIAALAQAGLKREEIQEYSEFVR
ncbi:hypothetical protein [Planctomicrobium sp. SH527]|uniref:hypothetical protein n=1 Tax=Planctomicrobium sp. SH527 TaxID=3448123 RepID=UPI003F5C0EE6